MTDYDEAEAKKSKYNSGVAKEIRRNKVWDDANTHSRNGNYSKWNMDLDRIWCELAGDLKYDKKEKSDKEYEEFKKDFDEFDTKLAKLGTFEDNPHTGFKKVTKNQISKRNGQYKILMNKELFLRRLEEYLGKGTKWEDDEEDFD